MVFTILFYAFAVVAAVQIVYYLFFLSFVYHKRKNNNNKVTIPISVIVYVRNNAEHLSNYIQDLIKQKHPNYEMVFVNNASSDNSLDIIEEFQKRTPKIIKVDVKNTEAFWANKKYALTLGVKAATHEHLLFTEVSSKALSQNWIGEMARHFSKEKSIVIGYQKLKRKKKSFGNVLIRFHHLLNTTQAFTFAKFNAPYQATNHNLAYTKNTFFKVNGYINHLHYFIGEADLFIKDATTKTNTTYTTKTNSFVSATKHLTLKQWFSHQKKEAILFKLYKKKHQFLLSLFKVSKLLFYVLAICISFINWKVTLPIIVFYFILQYTVIGKSASRFQEKDVTLLLPFYDICLVLLQISIFISNQISKPKHWK